MSRPVSATDLERQKKLNNDVISCWKIPARAGKPGEINWQTGIEGAADSFNECIAPTRYSSIL